MTIKEIKAMFRVADKWQFTREGFASLTINGNLGTTTMPAPNYTEVRIVDKAAAGNLITIRPSGTKAWAPWPKASEIIEARPGCLHWRYTGQPGTLKFELLTQPVL